MSKLKVLKQTFDYFINTDGAETNFHTVMPLAKYFARALWDCFDDKISRKISVKPLDEYDFWTKSKVILITLFGESDESFPIELREKYASAIERIAFNKAYEVIKNNTFSELEKFANAEKQKGEEIINSDYPNEIRKQAEYWQEERDREYEILQNTSEDNYWRHSEVSQAYDYADEQFKKYDQLYKSLTKNLSELQKLDKNGDIDELESYDGPMIVYADTLISPSAFEEGERFNVNELSFSSSFLTRFSEIINSKGYQIDNIEVLAKQVVIEIANAHTMAELFPTMEQENIFTASRADVPPPHATRFRQESIFDKFEQ